MQKEINEEIAGYFLNDSRLFLERYNLLKSKQTEIGNRSKLMIDLVFSMECSLKSILFFEAVDHEKKTYKKVRTHDLTKLLALVNDKSKIQQAATIIAANIDHFYVGSRYTLEANIRFRGEAFDLDKSYYDTIANPAWLDSVYKGADNLFKYASSLGGNTFKTFKFEDIDVVALKDKNDRIRALSQV